MIARLLELLVYPLSLSLLSGVAGAALCAMHRRRLGTVLIAFAFMWLALWSLPPVADRVGRSLEDRSPELAIYAVPRADVILVFGGVMRTSRPDHAYADLNSASDRVWHAARLYRAGKAPKVLLSGGRASDGDGSPSEASSMADFLGDLGVPRTAMILEERASTTRENAVFSAALMQREGLSTALLVTSALHMPRAAAAIRAAGVEVVPVATDFEAVGGRRPSLAWLPVSDALDRSTRALHEWAGIVVYRWRGWI